MNGSATRRQCAKKSTLALPRTGSWNNSVTWSPSERANHRSLRSASQAFQQPHGPIRTRHDDVGALDELRRSLRRIHSNPHGCYPFGRQHVERLEGRDVDRVVADEKHCLQVRLMSASEQDLLFAEELGSP